MFGSKGKIAQLLEEARYELAQLNQDILHKNLSQDELVRRITDVQTKIIHVQNVEDQVHKLVKELLKDA